MDNMIRKLLCRLGFHHWQSYGSGLIYDYGQHEVFRSTYRCSRCSQIREHYECP